MLNYFVLVEEEGDDKVPLAIDKSTQVLEWWLIYIQWHFGGSDLTPNYVDYDGR